EEGEVVDVENQSSLVEHGSVAGGRVHEDRVAVETVERESQTVARHEERLKRLRRERDLPQLLGREGRERPGPQVPRVGESNRRPSRQVAQRMDEVARVAADSAGRVERGEDID